MIKIGDKKYLEVKEYARHKGKTVQTVYNWMKEGKVKTRKLMDKVLIELY